MKVIIQPSAKNAFLAANAVKASQTNRRYKHYVQACGNKSSGGVISYSHLNITTDPSKASTDGYLLPEDWLAIQESK